MSVYVSIAPIQRLFLFLTILVLTVFPSRGDSVLIQSNNAQTGGDGKGFFTGVLTYTYSSGNTAALSIQLNNTSAVATNYYLTGFVLNNPGDTISSAVLSSFSHPGFQMLFDYRNDSAQPWGNFDLGAVVGTNWQNSRNLNYNKGLAPQTSATFWFTLSGIAANLAKLHDTDFVNALSTGGTAGKQFFAVRFQSATGAGDGEPGKDPPANNPEPTSLVLMIVCGIGAAGFSLRSRSRTITSDSRAGSRPLHS